VGGSGANIEDGSSLTIHWSSGSHKRSTNCRLINTTFILGTVLYGSRLILKNTTKKKIIILVGGPTVGRPGDMAPWTPLNPALVPSCCGWCGKLRINNSRKLKKNSATVRPVSRRRLCRRQCDDADV